MQNDKSPLMKFIKLPTSPEDKAAFDNMSSAMEAIMEQIHKAKATAFEEKIREYFVQNELDQQTIADTVVQKILQITDLPPFVLECGKFVYMVGDKENDMFKYRVYMTPVKNQIGFQIVGTSEQFDKIKINENEFI